MGFCIGVFIINEWKFYYTVSHSQMGQTECRLNFKWDKQYIYILQLEDTPIKLGWFTRLVLFLLN